MGKLFSHRSLRSAVWKKLECGMRNLEKSVRNKGEITSPFSEE